MDDSYLFKWCFAILFLLMSGIRLYSRIFYERRREIFSHHLDDGILLIVLRWVLAVPMTFSILGYVFWSDYFSFMYLSLPRILRIAGVILGFSSVCFLGIVHHYLGKNFNSASSPKENHTLITRGPYMYIRHPMYVSFILIFLSAFFITENWLIGVAGVSIILSLMTLRIAAEEGKLIGTFGDRYRKYMDKTGKFLPRIRK